MSNSVRPHRQQPTRHSRPWDSPGKDIGVGCHFLLQCMKMKSESEVAQSFPTLRDPMDYSLPGSSAHGIFQARVLEWGAIAFSPFDHRRQWRALFTWFLFSKCAQTILLFEVIRTSCKHLRKWSRVYVLMAFYEWMLLLGEASYLYIN